MKQVREFLEGASVPGWFWPILILVLNELIRYYTDLQTEQSALIVVVLVGVLKVIEHVARERTVVVEKTELRTQPYTAESKRGVATAEESRYVYDVQIEERPVKQTFAKRVGDILLG